MKVKPKCCKHNTSLCFSFLAAVKYSTIFKYATGKALKLLLAQLLVCLQIVLAKENYNTQGTQYFGNTTKLIFMTTFF